MARLFISHSSCNNDKAIEVRDWLAANGWDDVFLDLDPERGIVAGQRWKDALQKAAHRCEVVVALVSTEWLASGWCKAEIDAARLMGKKVIVALIGIDKSQVPLDLSDEQWVDLVGDPHGYMRLKEGLRRVGLDPSSFAFQEGRRPYPGFAFLDEKDAAIFFGRDAQIVRGMDKIRNLVRTGVDRILIILGASGSGKSSFLRAGLWPRLKRDDRTWLPLPIIRPERAVITGKFGLAEALHQKMSEAPFADETRKCGLPRSRDAIQDLIEMTEDGLLKISAALRDIAHAPGFSGEITPPPTIVLAVDQAEELFNEKGRDEAKRFVEILTRTLKADPRMFAILVMRSDSFPQLQAEPRVADLPKDTFTLDTMLEGSYRAVIEGPARLVQPNPLKIDPQLTDALLEDVSGQDALPLLAFTLAHLYDHYLADNELSLASYEKLGRLKGVIDTAVKETFAEGVARGKLPKDEKSQFALARLAFIPHLARVNEERQFVRRLATRDEIPPDARSLIDLFAERRLLTRDRRIIAGADAEVIEVAHEALLRQPPFSEWLAEDQEFLIWRERLALARAAFEAGERGLLIGRELQRARDFMQTRSRDDIAAQDRTFINESLTEDDKRQEKERKDRERDQRRELITRYARIAAGVGGTLALIAIIFGIYALHLKGVAEQASKRAEIQRQVAEQAKEQAEKQRKVAESLSAQNAELVKMLRLFVSARVPPEQEPRVQRAVGELLRGRDRYENLGKKLNIPWYFIGILHGAETGFNFDVHIHNGDPLTARTVHFPKGRPPNGDPPYSWEDSATDFFTMYRLTGLTDWSVDEMLFFLERFNGLGYRRHGVNSPYLWACTNHYTKGKYVADGRFDPNAVANFCGAAAIIRQLIDNGLVKID